MAQKKAGSGTGNSITESNGLNIIRKEPCSREASEEGMRGYGLPFIDGVEGEENHSDAH
ncbi:MAG: hypothetical protein M1504_00055 [Candidatus Marsarchaeota archaeon]|nr:hypothetical protein [Candidatus Marsarchaeota archaeon]